MRLRRLGNGVTLIETAITMTLLSIVIGSVMIITEATSGAVQTGSTTSQLDEVARKAIDEIALRLRTSSQANSNPNPQAPFSTSLVTYRRTIDFVDGALVWGNQERLGLQYSNGDGDDGLDNNTNGLIDECRVECIENFGLPDQRTIVLCNFVREYLEGETLNGIDDNGNGLIDERGLCFDFDGDRATIRLTLERLDSREFESREPSGKHSLSETGESIMLMTRSRTPSRRRGGALIFVVIVMASLAAMSAAMLSMGVSSSRRTTSRIADRRAFYLAESGAAEAVAALRSGRSGAVGSLATPALKGNGVFWVGSTDLGNGERRLLVTALEGSGRAALEVIVRTTASGGSPFLGAFRSKDGANVLAGMTLDSFDSSLGTYDSQAINTLNGHTYANKAGHVFSNKDVKLLAGAHVFGDARPGRGFTTKFGGGAYVSGTTMPMAEPLEFPTIQVPSVPVSGPLDVPSNKSKTLGPGVYHFTSMRIGKSSKLEIEGPATVITDDFAGGQFAELVVSGGSVTLICTGDFEQKNGFEAKPASGSPMDLIVLISKAQSLNFTSGSELRGAYYAPDCDITINAGTEVWGSVACKELRMTGPNAKFHFDEQLLTLDSSWTGAANSVEILSWAPAEIDTNLVKSDRRDPFVMLNVDKSKLPSPSQAWGD